MSRLRQHGGTEPLPKQLPFLLPENLVLPEEGQKALADASNPLEPVVSGEQVAAAPAVVPAGRPSRRRPARGDHEPG